MIPAQLGNRLSSSKNSNMSSMDYIPNAIIFVAVSYSYPFRCIRNSLYASDIMDTKM